MKRSKFISLTNMEEALEKFKEALKDNPKLGLRPWCHDNGINYDIMRSWMWRYLGKSITDIREEVRAEVCLERTGTRTKGCLMDNEYNAASCARVVRKTATRVEGGAMDICGQLNLTAEIDKALDRSCVDIPDDYRVYVLPTNIQPLIDMFQNETWELHPIMSKDIDAMQVKEITLEFPEGVKTTLKNAEIGNISKILAAYSVRKWVYTGDRNKVGIV